ncbi:protein phosphatase 2C domain-containing protein [Actinomyces sp. B33]|uniref:PP2C family protein-serine/threonine phosphatase n=1 Tax=Actinomyces sp. B33 TaxID=2942131 RepID=UPI002341E016|nr:PP2C family serine/threonine-protein phosphatase [Actinomyces sp. B33]MDC4233972.1 protein phosphatase 2C domain-containing protein [Actinomyces sp. B33]
MVGEPIEFHCAARSDVGLVRSNNQDSGYAGANLLILADGMGGPAGGDIASSVALAHLVPLDTDAHPADSMLPLLREALMDAHDELSERSSRDRDLEGLGTTCIAVMRTGNKLAMVHIGDSRAYLLRGRTLTQVTTDHSFVQYLVDTGQISPDEAEHHPNRNVVLRILGDSHADVSPDETVREAVVGDRWLLCSDGLSGVVSPETIGSVLSSHEDPGECAEELIRLALLAGGPDNITCVVCDIVPTGSFPPAPPQIVGAAAIDRNAQTRGGTGAAAKAASLNSKPRPPLDEDEADEAARVGWRAPLLLLVAAIVVAAGGWLAWAWSQTQYYALGEDGYVVIHQGIPQSIGSWDLSHPVEVTGIALTDLTPVDRQRLTEPVIRSSREEVDEYVAGLIRSAAQSAAAHAQSGPQSDAPQSGPQSGVQSAGALPQSGTP